MTVYNPQCPVCRSLDVTKFDKWMCRSCWQEWTEKKDTLVHKEAFESDFKTTFLYENCFLKGHGKKLFEVSECNAFGVYGYVVYEVYVAYVAWLACRQQVDSLQEELKKWKGNSIQAKLNGFCHCGEPKNSVGLSKDGMYVNYHCPVCNLKSNEYVGEN